MATAKKKTAKKTTKKRAPTKRQAIRELMGLLNSEERKIIAFADDAPNAYELRRPCGIMQLDIDTGGGLPAGGLSTISGPDNAGKTYLLLLYMVMHQKLYGDDSCIAFAASEGGFDFKSALRAGLKVSVPDRMLGQWQEARELRNLPPYTKEELLVFKEQIGEVVIIQGATGEETMNTLLACISKKVFGFIALDSVSSLIAQVDAKKDVGENDKMASHASLVGQFLKRYTPMTNTLNGVNETTVVFTQQVRANRKKAESSNPKYVKDYAVTGSWHLRHGKLIDLMVSSGEKIKRTRKKIMCVIGKMFKWQIVKGKAGTHDNIAGEAPFIYADHGGTGVDTTESLIICGIKNGVLSEGVKGAVNLTTPETGKVTVIAPSMKALGKIIESDFEFELQLRREILATAGIECLYR